MKKIIWIPLIILIIGVCLALAGFVNGGMKSIWFDRAGFHVSDGSPGNLVTVDETYNSFKNIEINVDYLERIVLKEGDAFAVRGQNYEQYGGLEVQLDNDTIKVNSLDDKKWMINVDFGELFRNNDTWLEVTYPAGAKIGFVNSKLSAGDISISSIDCDDFSVDNDFGKIDISSVQASTLTVIANAGDINIFDVIATGNVLIDNDFGDVTIDSIKGSDLDVTLNAGKLKTTAAQADNTIKLKNDFGKIEVNGMEADTITMDQNSGDFEANKVTARNLDFENDFGTVNLDQLTFTGICEIENSSGDIKLTLLMNRDDVSYDLETDAGSVSVDGVKSNGSISNRAAGGATTLNAKTDFGSIRVEFLK